MYEVWFQEYETLEAFKVECQELLTAQMVWDALSAKGFVAISKRP